jgi:adenylate cyclase
MQTPESYIPTDRLAALATGRDLPDRVNGAALFADVCGSTALTEALAKTLGHKLGVEALARHLNALYEAVIEQVHLYGGSVIGFSGDGVTCWFDGDNGRRAVSCGLSLQECAVRFSPIRLLSGEAYALNIKVAITRGPARRFLVGDPQAQRFDLVTGVTYFRLARCERNAQAGETIVGIEVTHELGSDVQIVGWRTDAVSQERFAVVSGLLHPADKAAWCRSCTNSIPTEQAYSWVLPPLRERLRTGQGPFLVELRPAVALFLQFGTLSAGSAEPGLGYDDDEAAGPKLDSFVRWVQAVLTRCGGHLIQLTPGDDATYLYAAFGAPIAHEDDPLRAAAAALELRSPPPELDFVGPLQIGISRGRMRTGPYGSPTRCTYGVLGKEVNLAARLMSYAGPGQVLVSQRIANAAGQHYEFRPIGLLQVKGIREPLPAFNLIGRALVSPQRPRARFGNLLVGRDEEMERLHALLASASAGRGWVVRVEGQAGVGKSRLVAEWLERARDEDLDFQVAVGACDSAARNLAYRPWQQVFHILLGLSQGAAPAQQWQKVEAAIAGLNPGWPVRLPLLGDLMNVPVPDNATTSGLNPEARQEAILALAIDVLQAKAASQPLLIIIEDAHWLDEPSQGLCLALGRIITGLPIVLAVVHRSPTAETPHMLPELDRLPGYKGLTLSELGRPEVYKVIRNRLEGKAEPPVLDIVLAQTDGNPFFVEEFLEALREAGRLSRNEEGGWALSQETLDALYKAGCLLGERGSWSLAPDAPSVAGVLGLSDDIHDLVLSRLDRLDEAHKLTLKIASVIGRDFGLNLLAAIHPHGMDPQMLDAQMVEIAGRDLVHLAEETPSRTYSFKHHITQEVMYEILPDDQRRELHGAIGEALEQWQPEGVELLAYHYYRSRRVDRAVFYLDRSARKAQRAFANEIALRYYDQALVLESRWAWFAGKAEVLHVLGRREAEREALEALRAVAGAPAFDANYHWGRYFEAIADYPQAQAHLERALDLCQSTADVLGQVRCLVDLGGVATRQGMFGAAQTWYERALALLPRRGTRAIDETTALARVLNGLGIAHVQQEHFDQARTCWDRALQVGHDSGNLLEEAQALSNLGLLSAAQRDFAGALAYHQKALEIRRTIGHRAGEGSSLYNMAAAYISSGDYGQAETILSKALELHRATGDLWNKVKVQNLSGVLWLLLGEWERAVDQLRDGARQAEDIGDRAARADALCNLGLCYSGAIVRAAEDLPAAMEALDESLTIARDPHMNDRGLAAMCHSYLALVYSTAGKHEEAIHSAGAALALRQELGLERLATIDLTSLGLSHHLRGDMDAALCYAERALAILDDCEGQGPEFAERDYDLSHRILRAAGRGDEAQRALHQAYRLVMEKAGRISDPALRCSYLERVRFNREIVDEHRARPMAA